MCVAPLDYFDEGYSVIYNKLCEYLSTQASFRRLRRLQGACCGRNIHTIYADNRMKENK